MPLNNKASCDPLRGFCCDLPPGERSEHLPSYPSDSFIIANTFHCHFIPYRRGGSGKAAISSIKIPFPRLVLFSTCLGGQQFYAFFLKPQQPQNNKGSRGKVAVVGGLQAPSFQSQPPSLVHLGSSSFSSPSHPHRRSPFSPDKPLRSPRWVHPRETLLPLMDSLPPGSSRASSEGKRGWLFTWPCNCCQAWVVAGTRSGECWTVRRVGPKEPSSTRRSPSPSWTSWILRNLPGRATQQQGEGRASPTRGSGRKVWEELTWKGTRAAGGIN